MVSRPPRQRKMVYPFRISTDSWGRRQKGTSAFLPRGTSVSPDLLKRLTEELRLRGRKRPTRGRVASDVTRERQRLAEQSDFFIKPVNARIRAVRERLIRAGILVEQPIEDLKNNMELFRRGNFSEVLVPDSYSPEDYSFRVKNRLKFSVNLRTLVTRMHLVGVSHNHLHLRNVLLSPSGGLQLLDLSKARFFHNSAKSKADFLKRFAGDIRSVSLALSMLRSTPTGDTRDSDSTRSYVSFMHELKMLLSQHESSGIRTFGVTPTDIINYHYSKKKFIE